MSKLRFLVYSSNPETLSRVGDDLLRTERVVVTTSPTDLSSLQNELRRTRIDGIYLDLDDEPDRVLEFVAAMAEPLPTILLGAQQSDPELLLQAMRLGVRNFFPGHDLAGVESILLATSPRRVHSQHGASTIAVVGAKGGVGATMVACELAVSLQEAGLNAIVCDLSRRLGDVGIYFDLSPRFNIADLVKHEGDLDEVFIDAVLDTHRSDVSVLTAPTEMDDVTVMSKMKIDRLLKALRHEFDCVVLDVPWDFDEFSLRALNLSNEILLVTTPDVTAITHTRNHRKTIESFGAMPEHIHTLLNRASADASINPKQVAKYLEGELDGVIPEIPKAARRCADEGLILREVPDGQQIRDAILDLRTRVCEWCQIDIGAEAGSTGRGGLMTQLRGLVGRT